MVHIRWLTALLIAGSLAVSSCALCDRTTSQPSSVTQQEPTATSDSGLGGEANVPSCFSPHELLPFAFSPDNSKLAVRGSQGAQFFDIVTGQEVASLTASHGVISAALSPDGGTLAWSLDDNTIQLVRVSDGAIQHTLIGHPDPVFDLRFSPSGSELFSASHDGTVRVWDTVAGTPFPSMEIGLEVLGIGVSPDGGTLAVVPGYGPIQLWDIVTAQQIGILGGTGGYDTSDPVFSPDSMYLAVDLATGIFIWTLPDGRDIWSEVANSMGVAYSPDGRYLAYTDIDEDNKVFLGPADAQGDFYVIDQMRGPVWELFFSPDSSLLAATDGIEIRVWRVSDGDLFAIGKPSCE
jgi:WD40 repeat protein